MSTPRPAASVGFGAVVALVALASMWATTVPAGADPLDVQVDQVGWWTDRVAAAPTPEDDGFEVAAGIDGEPQSIAAIQVTVAAARVDRFDVTLAETASTGGQLGSLVVCRTDEPWTPADPGALDDAPTPDCATRVHLTHVLEEQRWIGDLATLLAEGGTASLVVMADYAPPTPIGPGMVVRIGGIEVEAEGSSQPAPTTTTTLDFETPGGGNRFDDVGDSGFTSGPAPLAPPPPGASTVDIPGTGDAPEPAPSEADEEVAADDEFFVLDAEEAVAGERRPWIRLVVLVPLSAGIGYASAQLRRLVQEGRGLSLPGFAGRSGAA